GSLTPVLRGGSIHFQNAQGATVLTYDQLHVTDAAGKTIPARLELHHSLSTIHHSPFTIRILVFDKDALYPLTIDPWVQTAKLTASDGAAYDRFGYSVAVSENTVVVGAQGDADNGIETGAAYVFVKPGSGWADMPQTAKLTASDGAAGDHFGYSVAVSGDTVVAGAVGDDDTAVGQARPTCLRNRGAAGRI
ncbi:MAG: hypothetical protein GY797_37180, partial [Deltaproteobacteria bacterium]|nr:hypothetical protein [Deltaproteobacteria bacterium]